MFRFNNRKNMNDRQRFTLAMSQISGKRLTYSQLTGKNDSPRHDPARTWKEMPKMWDDIPF